MYSTKVALPLFPKTCFGSDKVVLKWIRTHLHVVYVCAVLLYCVVYV